MSQFERGFAATIKFWNTDRISLLICSLFLLGGVVFFSNAGIDTMNFVLFIYTIAAWAVFLLVRIVIAFLKKCHTRFVRSWTFELVTVIFTLSLSYFGGFSLLRFYLSEKSLTSYAEEVRAGKVDLAFEFSHAVRRVGLYEITVTELLKDGTVRVVTSNDGFFDQAGFAFSSSVPPMKQGKGQYQRIDKQWRYWKTHF